MKKRLAIIGAVCVVLAVIAAGTIAYLTTEGRATNIITTGTVELKLNEMMDIGGGELAEYPSDALKGIMPGQTVSKIPFVENVGSQPFYTRVRIDISVTASDGDSKLPTDVIVPNIDTANWVAGTDGWYYYNGIVDAGDKVAPFDEVEFKKTMSNEYQDCDVEIDVVAQAVQSKNNPIPSEGTILDITGWPVDSTSGQG